LTFKLIVPALYFDKVPEE